MFQANLVLSLPKPWDQLFLQEALVPFRGELYLEVKVCVLGILIALVVVLLRGPVRKQPRNTCM